ncbi:hypothetical protein GU926_00300 [Nibribacter ruber]|uniref:TerB family tellurite resistance protein n=1 Tax=Nibribacter ruber TaxID=2698458 RepID=A0A6P1NW11_9BACT|nr:hypothetical protein [Nibribacter ruber]QHL85965.1 hypothetical protein GU926_00300 [Nibribacter ruber]
MATGKSFEELFNTQQKKLAFFQNLILAAVADRQLDEQESEFLLTIGNRLNLSAEDARPLVDNLSLLSFVIPEDGLQRTLELQTVIMMVLQDGHIEDKEYQLCLEYARRIGYAKETVDEMIDQLSQGEQA